MDFGAELDDDLFEVSQNKKTEASVEYIPKVYNSEWYLQPDYNQMEEHPTQLKSYADYLYYHHKYADCAQKYLECLSILQSSNITMRRDCLEGIARSLLHQEHLSQALVYALELLDVACNIDHKVVAWNLLASIYHQMGRYSDEMDMLHCCLQRHAWNYDFWLRLAFCYSSFFGIELNSEILSKLTNIPKNIDKGKRIITCESSKTILYEKTDKALSKCGTNREHDTKPYFLPNEENKKCPELCESFCLKHNLSGCQKSVNKINSNHDRASNGQHCSYSTADLLCVQCGTLIICACLVRARLLLQTCILGYRSFAQESNLWQQEQISLLLNSMDVEKKVIEHCTQVYLRDIGNQVVDSIEDKSVLDKLKEKSVAEEEEPNAGNIARKQFETKWFGWLFT